MNTKERLNNLLQDLQQRFFRTIPGVLWVIREVRVTQIFLAVVCLFHLEF
jgi:hypothetical protein